MRRVLLGMVAVVAVGLGVLAWVTDVLRRPELATLEMRFDVRGVDRPSPDVVVVALDDETLRRLNVRPPIPRSYHARVIDRLRAAGARTIAYDFEFTEPTTAAEDDALLRALGRARNVVLAGTRFTRDGDTDVLDGADNVRRFGARVGSAAFPPDLTHGGVIRRVPFADHGFPSFAVAAAGRRPAGDDAWIAFAGPAGTYPPFPLHRVLDGEQPPGGFRDRIVVVGATTLAAKDIYPTSAGPGMAGVEVQANAIATVLENAPLDDAPGWLSALVLVLAGAATPGAALRMMGLRWLAVPLVLVVGLAVAAQLAFAGGTILPVAAPALTLVPSAAGTFAVAYGTDLRDRRRLRAAFGRFVPPSVVDEVVAAADGSPRLGGVERDATVVFCDLRGFTTLAEQLGPQRVIDLLTAYLTAMSDAVLDHGGTVVSYQGDGIMAVFGAPLVQPDHADRALAAACTMLGPQLAAVNAYADAHGIAGPLRIGVGIASGPVLSGNVGSLRRLEYAAVGDTTNTAARLQAMTKEQGVPLLVADATRAALTRSPPAELHPVGELQVRGRAAPLRAWTLAAGAENARRATRASGPPDPARVSPGD